MNTAMSEFLRTMPKAELHLHIEGTVEPRKVLELAERNGVDIPYSTEQQLIDAQDYGEPALDNFLDYHYMCTGVLRTGRDIFEITERYLERCAHENIRHTELSFDPQAHIERGVEFDELIEALNDARRKAADRNGTSTHLIMCMNRDRSQDDALRMLDLAQKHQDDIVGVGLDSYEEGNPPIKFVEFYKRAKSEGYRLTAHCDCDQKNSALHIHQCIHDLGVERIDHGIHCLDEPSLHEEIKKRGIALTMCPTWRPSDPAPRRLAALRQMLDLGLQVNLNTDDPEEFASRYLTNTLVGVQREGGFTAEEMTHFMRNAFLGSWINEQQRATFLNELDQHHQKFRASAA